MLKAENQKSNALESTSHFDYQISPNLIKPLSKYIYWYEVAQVLTEFG